MRSRLKNIRIRGDGTTTLLLAVEVIYGFEGTMHGDIIQIQSDRSHNKTYLTVRALNPGVGSVIQRFIESFNKIPQGNTIEEHLKNIIEYLSEKIGMEYDAEKVRSAISTCREADSMQQR